MCCFYGQWMSAELHFICSTLSTDAAQFFLPLAVFLVACEKSCKNSCKKVEKKLQKIVSLVGNPACILSWVKVRWDRVTNTRQRAHRGRVRHQNDVEGLLCKVKKKHFWKAKHLRRYDMNGRPQMQGGKHWILPKDINANGCFWGLSLAGNLDKPLLSLYGTE